MCGGVFVCLCVCFDGVLAGVALGPLLSHRLNLAQFECLCDKDLHDGTLQAFLTWPGDLRHKHTHTNTTHANTRTQKHTPTQ